MRQFHIFFNQAKNWHRIVCWFLCFYLFLPVFAWCDHNIVLQIKTKQFSDHIMQKLVKTQNSTNNPISSFGLIETKIGAALYLLSCTQKVQNFGVWGGITLGYPNFWWPKLLFKKTTKTIKTANKYHAKNIPAFCLDISSIFWQFIRYARNRFKIRAFVKPSKLRFHQVVGHCFVKITIKSSLFKFRQQICFSFFISFFEAFKCLL